MVADILRVLVGCSVLLSAALAWAQEDWAQWRGPQRNGVATGVKLPKSWPTELQQVWQVEVGLGHASPIAAGQRVFVFSREEGQEVVQALALADGKQLWRQAYDAPYEVSPPAAGHGKGPKSTPLVADSRLYTLGISGILSCWDAESGELKWRKEFSKQFKHTAPLYGTAMSPLLDGGRLIVHIGGPDQGALVALDAASGETQWSWEDDGPAYASPIVAELSGKRQVITQSQNACVGLDAEDGKLLWKISFKTDYDQNSITPVVYEESIIFSGYNKGVDRYRIEKDDDGDWRTDELWENKEVSLYMSSPVISGEQLIGFSHRQKGQLFALDVATGRTLWISEGRLADNASLVRTGEVLWALTTQAELIVLANSDKSYEELARYKVGGSATWAHPLIFSGGVLIKDESHLTRWNWQATPPGPPAASGRANLSRNPRG